MAYSEWRINYCKIASGSLEALWMPSFWARFHPIPFLCGKRVAMLATCDTVRYAFNRKYGGKRSVIKQQLQFPSQSLGGDYHSR